MQGGNMNKILKIFITVCAVIIGVYSAYEGIKQIIGTPSSRSAINYIDQIGPISKKTADVMNGLAPYLNNPNIHTQEVIAKVSDAKKELEVLDAQTKAIQPPEQMAALHLQFEEAMGKYVQAFSLTESGLKYNNDAQLGEAGTMLTDGAMQMQKVSNEIAEIAKR